MRRASRLRDGPSRAKPSPPVRAARRASCSSVPRERRRVTLSETDLRARAEAFGRKTIERRWTKERFELELVRESAAKWSHVFLRTHYAAFFRVLERVGTVLVQTSARGNARQARSEPRRDGHASAGRRPRGRMPRGRGGAPACRPRGRDLDASPLGARGAHPRSRGPRGPRERLHAGSRRARRGRARRPDGRSDRMARAPVPPRVAGGGASRSRGGP